MAPTRDTEWRSPCAEDRCHCRSVLGIEAAEFDRSVIDVERGGKVAIARPRVERPALLPAEIALQPGLFGHIGVAARRQMLLYISEAAEQPLFFARPQGEADRALGPHAHVGEDARRLDRKSVV